MVGYIFLAVLVFFTLGVLWVTKNRNAWDILFFNSTLATLALFMVGILANDLSIWKVVAIALGVIATGEKIVGFFVRNKDE